MLDCSEVGTPLIGTVLMRGQGPAFILQRLAGNALEVCCDTVLAATWMGISGLVTIRRALLGFDM